MLSFGLVELWGWAQADSPSQQCFSLLVQGSWHSALPSAEICKPDYIPKHMFGNEKQPSEVSGIALIENLKSKEGKPGCSSELSPTRKSHRQQQLWALLP